MLDKITDRIKALFTGQGMRALALKGGIWLSAGSGLEYSLRFLRNIILARLLVPESFGLMAIVLAVNAGLGAFTYIGINEAVIQSPDGREETYLNAAWWLSLFRSAGLFALAVVALPWFVSFYSVERYSAMFMVSFLSIIFTGAMSARAYIAQKEMDFKKWMLISNGGSAIGILTAIGLTFWLHSIWALVIGYVMEAAGRCLLSFIVCPYLPRLHFSKEHTKTLWTYASGMFGLPILYFLFREVDVFVIGKLLPKRELGLYSMSMKLAQMPILLVSTVLNPILMPMFSAKQTDKQWINRVLIKSTAAILLAGSPIVCFCALYGKDLLTVVYGPQYAAMALPFAILLTATLLRTVSTPITNVYFAIGKPQLQRLFLIIRAVLMIIIIYPAIRFLGLTGAAGAGLIAMLAAYFFQVLRIWYLGYLDIRRYGAIFLYGIAVSMIVFAVWVAAKRMPLQPIHNMLVGFTWCAAAYVFLGVMAFKIYRKAA
ncbi:MAG: oligosaccharide flippase family protein [Actinomycetota bacterium]|nr:oligosaccharide flippase family protein [Nitrospiraceae bacterium]MDA8155558.1 oligosaccharide flippase family protein [Actinomycetota bacterium]